MATSRSCSWSRVEAPSEVVDRKAPFDSQLYVGETVSQRECDLLRSRRTSFANVVSADADGVIVRHIAVRPLEQVADEAQVWSWREQPLLLRDVLLEDVGLQRPGELRHIDASTLRGDDVAAEERDCWSTDRHRRRDRVEWDIGEELDHVSGGVDGNPAMAHFASARWVIGVEAHQGWHVKGNAQAVASGVQQLAEPAVGVGS